MAERVLVIGRNGQLATALRAAAPGWAALEVLARPEVDLAAPQGLADRIAAVAPALVINAAAYTAVDKAESEPQVAHAVNALAAGEVARGAAEAGAPVIHVSTDYVFDGTQRRPYREDDPTAPLGVYGRTKREGEERVAAANPRHVIARTAWVYSAHGANFVKTMLRLGAERDELAIVSDQVGCPTAAADLAGAVLAMADKILHRPEDGDFGVTHACGTGIASWYDVAKAVFAALPPGDPRRPLVRPILTEDYPTPARRPANSRLETTRLEQRFAFTPPPWPDSLRRVVAALAG